jgi:hypothetical protein
MPQVASSSVHRPGRPNPIEATEPVTTAGTIQGSERIKAEGRFDDGPSRRPTRTTESHTS